MEDNFEIIKSVESKLFNKIKENKFVLVDGCYINVSGSLKERIKRLADLKDLNRFPSVNPLMLFNAIYSFLKSEKIKWSNILGTLIMSLLKQKVLIFNQSDYFICRKQIISIYSFQNQPFVLKTCSNNPNTVKQIEREIKSYLLIESLKLETRNVKVPKVLSKGNVQGLPYFTLEYIRGNNLTGKNKEQLLWVYIAIFDYLFEVYKKLGVKLHLIDYHHHTNNITKVQKIIANLNGFEFILSIFKCLSKTKKKLPYSFIHRDLSHNNIILKGNEIYIIDFGKSKKGFLVEDWDTDFFDSEIVFEKFLKEFSIDVNDVFSFFEQVYLIRFLEIIKLVNNGDFKKIGFKNKIQVKIKKLTSYYFKHKKHISVKI